MDKQNSRYRWVVFITVLLTYCLIASLRTAPGLITGQLMKEFNITAATVGLLTSAQFFAYAGLQIPFGLLSDRYGPNLFLIAGTALCGLGTLIYSLTANEFVLLLARLLSGIGDATIWVNLVLILNQWFKVKEFVGLVGIAGMCGSLGFLLATVPFSAWITLSGWRPPFFIMGMILCLFAGFLYFVLVKKPNDSLIKKEQKREGTIIMLRRLFTNRQVWAMFFCHFGIVGTYIGFIGSWAVPFGMNVYGMSMSEASQFVMTGVIGAIIGAPLTSLISSRLGTIKRPYVIVHMLIFISWSTFVLLEGNPPIIVLFLLFFIVGYGSGASTLTFAAVRQSFPIKEVGVVSGFANTGGFLSAVLLPAIFGKVLDHFQTAESYVGYHYGFIISVFFSVLGLTGVLFIKEQRQVEKKTSEFMV